MCISIIHTHRQTWSLLYIRLAVQPDLCPSTVVGGVINCWKHLVSCCYDGLIKSKSTLYHTIMSIGCVHLSLCEVLDDKGYHLLVCKHGGPVWQHNSIMLTWADYLTELRIQHHKEPKHHDADNENCPDSCIQPHQRHQLQFGYVNGPSMES